MLMDSSGRRLGSLFEGLAPSQANSELRRLEETRKLRAICGHQLSSLDRLWQWATGLTLALGLNSVVHAQSGCGGCGYTINYWAYCARSCSSYG